MTHKGFRITLVMPNCTIAAGVYPAAVGTTHFECENAGVDIYPSTSLEYPGVYPGTARTAHFECENAGVDSYPSTTLEFPTAACLQSFLAELKKMAETCPGFPGILSNPNRLIRLK